MKKTVVLLLIVIFICSTSPAFCTLSAIPNEVPAGANSAVEDGSVTFKADVPEGFNKDILVYYLAPFAGDITVRLIKDNGYKATFARLPYLTYELAVTDINIEDYEKYYRIEAPQTITTTAESKEYEIKVVPIAPLPTPTPWPTTQPTATQEKPQDINNNDGGNGYYVDDSADTIAPTRAPEPTPMPTIEPIKFFGKNGILKPQSWPTVVMVIVLGGILLYLKHRDKWGGGNE